MLPSQSAVILFDGVCNLCEISVLYIIKHDRKGYYRFAALQSKSGQNYLLEMGLKPSYNKSLVLIQNGKSYRGSEAALRIAKRLGGFLSLCYYMGIWIPRPLRDWLYQIISRKRYKWFGKKTACLRPTPALKARFL